MTYLDRTIGVEVASQEAGGGTGQAIREAVVVLVEDDFELSSMFGAVCECLSVAVERMSSRGDLDSVLRERQPMAVVARMEADGQDGCHVLMTVAAHDRDVPVMLISGSDPALLGAIDAIEEIWQLTSVLKLPQLPGIGAIVDFLFRAGRKGGCMRLMST